MSALREIRFGSMTDNVDPGNQKPMVGRAIQAKPFRLNNERNIRAEGIIVGGRAIFNKNYKIRIRTSHPSEILAYLGSRPINGSDNCPPPFNENRTASLA